MDEGVNGDQAAGSREGRAEPGHRLDHVIPAPTEYARSYRVRQATVVELAGEIDLGSARGIHPHLDAAALWPLPLLVVFDLGPLEFIDCYGLALLVRARRRVIDRGGRTAMVCTHPPTRKLLAMTGLDTVFLPVPTLDEALGA
ncbi:anti-sigma factor antagonist [Streptomyces cocklensis]|uniref:Anti-sigma factor antagonist n=1 Tax=Actinacidiphila cocklensis TaxID=887465 RepID=A0A9W4DWB9_9ACTN|nr:anti-sigma factor antagonist [Actinacidiphila cocklensis]MDD1056868.1 anti-sigma factor antagonist [Actinacidiphila cocklensis]CAG6397370.1 Anti-sigma factor antagonist [Actinacidiphila cocklensis]